jgi:type IX secretion system PorP/SprF family membrane protein
LYTAIFTCYLSQAQDPHFSQYFASPMMVNPALIGKGVSDWRAMTNYRSQWWSSTVSPFTTTTIALEKSFHTGTSDKNTLGIGFGILSDASNSGLLKNNYFILGAAYNLALNAAGTQLLGIGLEGSYANRLLDANKFEFQSQFGSMGFQRSAPSGDPVSVLSSKYWDMNVGIHYSNHMRNWGYYLGTALYHAANPVDGSFSNTTYTIDKRISFQGGLSFYGRNKNEFHITSNTDLQGEHTVFSLGALYKVKLLDEHQSINVGLFNRFDDALYPYFGLELNSFLIGISYDIVTSKVKTTSVQSLEFSFAWQFGSSKKNKPERKGMLIY